MNSAIPYYKPSLGGSWLLVGLMLAGSLVGAMVTMLWKGVPQSLTYCLMMAVPLLFCVWMGTQARNLGGSRLAIHAPHYGSLPAWLFFVLAGVALLTLSVVSDPLTTLFPMPDSIKAIFEKAFVNSALWDMILSTCILAPLLEELLCRGMMLRGMLANGKAPWKAIFWSSFLFAFMHMNPWQAIPAFLIGLLMGWVYWRTHSLWATIFLHCLNNSISTVISRLWPDLPMDAGLRDILPPATWWLVFAASAVILILVLWLLHEKTVSPQVQAPVEA